VYQLCLCDEGDAQAGRLFLKFLEALLEPADVATIGEGGYCESEVVHIRDHQTTRDPKVQWRHIEEEEERGDR